MSKRLTLILALAFVVGISCAAYAEVQNVKVSGDITVIGATRELGLDNGNSGAGQDADKSQFIAGITRLRVDADLTDMVSATVRLINERLWGEANGSSSEDATDIDIDLAYVTLKEFLYSPLTLTVGLQNLRFGNAMIVGDPLTNNVAPLESIFATAQANEPDLTMRKAFEAIRATLDYDPLTVDIITAKIAEGTKTLQDDHDLHGVNLNYKVDDNTVAEGYYFLKYYGREGFPVAGGFRKPMRIDTLGARVQTKVTDQLTYHLEAAWQLGKGVLNAAGTDLISAANRRAFAVETAAAMVFPDTKYVPSLTGLYAYFSGQKGDVNKKVSAWDPMYEDQKFGDIANAQFPQSNAHILGAIGTMKPTDDMTLVAEYYAYWWDKKYGDLQSITSVRGDTLVMRHNKFAGQELDLKAIYDYTEDVQFGLMTGLFFPGDAFDKVNSNVASEVIGSMKVTF
jgi:hypothetical protein